MELNEATLRKICRDLGLYSTPELNDKLFLHYKGFKKIQSLEPYSGLKVLYLEGNGLSEIEGLTEQRELRCLLVLSDCIPFLHLHPRLFSYLQENMISDVRGLDSLVELSTLNLNQNLITSLPQGCFSSAASSLSTLQLSSNRIHDISQLAALSELSKLSVLDLSKNHIADPAIIDLLCKIPTLKVLYLKDNPVCEKISPYRKILISRLPALTYLDERPVDDNERLLAEAWARGGEEAERAERQRQTQCEHDRVERYHRGLYVQSAENQIYIEF